MMNVCPLAQPPGPSSERHVAVDAEAQLPPATSEWSFPYEEYERFGDHVLTN